MLTKFNSFFMNNPQVTISYNGHRTAVTCLSDNIYLVQISPCPYHIQYKTRADGTGYWVEVEDHRETSLANDIGRLIREQQLKEAF